MGMTCTLHRATDAEIERLIEDPAALDSFLVRYEGPAPQVRTVRPQGLLGFLLRLTPITISEAVSDPAESATVRVPDPEHTLDIEKGWHGLHFLFTGTADEGEEPACYLVRGGEDLDDEGQVRALRPNQVRRFAEYLSALTTAELEQRYDPQRMKKLEIYPDVIWTRPASPDESPLEWLLECFSDVQAFINTAAQAGDGVVVQIS